MPVKAPAPSSSSGAFSRQAEGSAGARPGATRVQPAENSRPDGDGARSLPGGLGRSAPRGFDPPTPRHLLFTLSPSLPPRTPLYPPGRWQRLQRRGSGWGAAAPPLPHLGRASSPPQPPPPAPSPRWRLRSMSACRREALPCEGSAVVTPTFARSSPRVLKIGTVANYNRVLKTVSRHPRKNE